MPKGVYIKKSSNKLEIGDIIIFKINAKKGNLLKYVAGREGDEYCFDFRGTLWINGSFAASKNIRKYNEEVSNQSKCEILKKGIWLVLGEHPDSYDSRYFGPISSAQIIAQVELAWRIGQH